VAIASFRHVMVLVPLHLHETISTSGDYILLLVNLVNG